MPTACCANRSSVRCSGAHRAGNLAAYSDPMANGFLPDETGSTKRPGLISALGALTFINAGAFTLVYALGVLGMLAMQQMPLDEVVKLFDDARATLGDDGAEQLDVLVPVLHAHGAALMGILLARTVLRLIGAIGMWRGRRSGFHLYAAAQLLGIFAPHIFLPWSLLGVFGPLMAVGMTAAYGSQLRRFAA